MIARQFILRGKENFKRVEKEGKVFQFESFGLSILRRGDEENSRFAFIVSTKISKEAVSRNRIKRAISEAVRFAMTNTKNGYDAIFLAKPIATRKSTDALMKEVEQALGKADLMKNI